MTELKLSRATSTTATRAVALLPLRNTSTAVSVRALPTITHSLRPSADFMPSSFRQPWPGTLKLGILTKIHAANDCPKFARSLPQICLNGSECVRYDAALDQDTVCLKKQLRHGVAMLGS